MIDLALGDAHLIPLVPRAPSTSGPSRLSDDDTGGRDTEVAATVSDGAHEYLCLLVALREHSHSLNPSALALGLVALAREALRLGASVHLPRFGERDDRSQWYAAERLIRKHLADRGVPAVMYAYAQTTAFDV